MTLNENQLKAYEYGLVHHPNLREGCKVSLEEGILRIELAENNAILEKIFKHDNTKASLLALLKKDEVKEMLGFDFSNLISIMCIR
ncbi:hypothetical protein IB685_01515 [Francisella tularensis subsp. novicida FSC159]|uniref:hypothetical protein n=1 Tax=Francisella tularensis TaxID=263 RepID=UPI001C0F0D82|nr:hypothetical protein [Francisella tularensis]MBK2110859.1 hypothetical protein [Francisella tularensis subsp. novicida FSC159]